MSEIHSSFEGGGWWCRDFWIRENAPPSGFAAGKRCLAATFEENGAGVRGATVPLQDENGIYFLSAFLFHALSTLFGAAPLLPFQTSAPRAIIHPYFAAIAKKRGGGSAAHETIKFAQIYASVFSKSMAVPLFRCKLPLSQR